MYRSVYSTLVCVWVCILYSRVCVGMCVGVFVLKGIYPEFQVIRGFSQKIPAGLLSYDQIHS